MSTEPETEPDLPSANSRNWAMGAHIAGLVAGHLIPFGGILGPMVIWLMKREEDPFVGDQALEAMNFQITVALAAIVSALLILVVVGIFALIAVALANIVLCVMAAIAAAEGRRYRYPWALRLVGSS